MLGGRKLDSPANRKFGCIEVGIHLQMRNIKGFTHFGEAMDPTVQGSLIRNLEVRIVQEIAKDVLVFETIHTPRDRTTVLHVALLLQPG